MGPPEEFIESCCAEKSKLKFIFNKKNVGILRRALEKLTHERSQRRSN